MAENFFAYGSLMLPEVMQSVTDGTFTAESATLRGYARYRLRELSYPGLVPEPAAHVDGVLYRNVHEDAFVRLDYFEGDQYVRTEVKVEVEAEGENVGAQTYVLVPAERELVCSEPWDLDEFRERLLRQFVLGYPGFRRIDDDEEAG